MDWRLFWGVLFIFLSFAIAKLNTVALIINYDDAFWRWTNIIIYLLTWPMLIFGIFLCGREGLRYAERFTKYLTYKYYHEATKEKTKHLAKHGKKAIKRAKKRMTPKKYIKRRS